MPGTICITCRELWSFQRCHNKTLSFQILWCSLVSQTYSEVLCLPWKQMKHKNKKASQPNAGKLDCLELNSDTENLQLLHKSFSSW